MGVYIYCPRCDTPLDPPTLPEVLLDEWECWCCKRQMPVDADDKRRALEDVLYRIKKLERLCEK